MTVKRWSVRYLCICGVVLAFMAALAAATLAAAPSDSAASIPFVETVPFSDRAWELLKARLLQVATQSGTSFPHVTEDHVWKLSKNGDWTGGFFPGQLWLAATEAERRGDKDAEVLRQQAIAFTSRLAPRQYDTGTHDLGFLFWPWMEAYRQTGGKEWRNGALQAAQSLSLRFAPGGFIQSWGPIGRGGYAGTVIIDNMMNLELLFWAAKEGNRPALYDMAVSHARMTQRHHIRADGGSFHLVDFNRDTGVMVRGRTHQGLAADSTWSRGQAWGIAGFTLAAKYTGDNSFLDTAAVMTDYFFRHLPADGVAPWDFQAGSNAAKDTSANVIAAYGLLEMAELLERAGKGDEAAKRVDQARRLLAAVHPYSLFVHPALRTQGGLLTGGTQHYRAGQAIEQCVSWGDYYYLRALLMLAAWEREHA